MSEATLLSLDSETRADVMSVSSTPSSIRPALTWDTFIEALHTVTQTTYFTTYLDQVVWCLEAVPHVKAASKQIFTHYHYYWSIYTMHSVFCEEIKWTDASALIHDRTYFWQQTIRTISSISLLWRRLLATTSTECMLGNLAQHCKSRSLSANQICIK